MIISLSHNISCGHRLPHHAGKCAKLHGHNYKIHFYVSGDINNVGMVIDFQDLKSSLCDWLNVHWDHKLLLWENDPIWEQIHGLSMYGALPISFVPTAENMANYLLNVVGPRELPKQITLVKVIIEETEKCSAIAQLKDNGLH
jgi:6-pyruvoyltetrahydropterin/6-carboxytetrahydropterin synthase